jgi:hypothetical protein
MEWSDEYAEKGGRSIPPKALEALRQGSRLELINLPTYAPRLKAIEKLVASPQIASGPKARLAKGM